MPEKFDDTPFLKPGGYCTRCVGRKDDHAPGCDIESLVVPEERQDNGGTSE